MSLESTEAMIVSISKDVERVTAAVEENAILFRENQKSLQTLLIELREHKAIDDMIHQDVKLMQERVFGIQGQPGLVTKVHDVENKVGNMWKVLWATIGAAATGLVGTILKVLQNS